MRSLRRNSMLSALLVGWLALAPTARAMSPGSMPWDRLGEELSDTRRPVGGNWSDSGTWNARLCEGRFNYTAAVNAVLTKVNFELQEDGSLIAKARLVDITSNGNGNFRSWSTACVTVGGHFQTSSPWAEVDVQIHFDESDEGYTKIRLRVLRTALGQVHISDWVPGFAERLFTKSLNKTLGWVWGSSLGAWISDKIGAKVVEMIPNPAPGIRFQ